VASCGISSLVVVNEGVLSISEVVMTFQLRGHRLVRGSGLISSSPPTEKSIGSLWAANPTKGTFGGVKFQENGLWDNGTL
jgi:hypothetical protein